MRPAAPVAWLALLGLPAVVGACAGPGRSPRGAPPATARCAFDEAFPGSGIAWQGRGATPVRRGPATYVGGRLVLDVRDAAGGTTEAIVDTGTSCVFLTAASPAARTAVGHAGPLRLLANEGTTAFDGRDATLPLVDLGGLAARDVPVFLVNRPHSLQEPGNVVGMAWLADLTLAHDAPTGAWSLRDDAAGPRGGPGPAVALEGRNFPVVPVLDDAGRRVLALVDTGTPTSLYAEGTPAGRYRVVGPDGATRLEVHARARAPWRGLAPRGKPIAVWIGLEDLARATWRLDFARGRWEFGPTPVPATPR